MTHQKTTSLSTVFAVVLSTMVATTSTLAITTVRASGPPNLIQFDLPPTSVAAPVATESLDLGRAATVGTPVRIGLQLSSMVPGGAVPELDHWLIRCVPRDPSWRVLSYSPQTETGSDLEGPIQVKRTHEKSHSSGVSADMTGGMIARAHLGADTGGKHSDSVQFDRRAPLHAVTAAGTVDRGRGVYYKLKWTSQQVLEGEKYMSVTFDVPPGFRSGLLDVSVVAYGKPAKKCVWSDIPVLTDSDSAGQRVGQATFVVATYLDGDTEAWHHARKMADAESTLRQAASSVRADTSIRSIPTLIRHVAAKLDSDAVDLHGDWVERLVAGEADPYMDPVIRKLPTELRVKTLDYCDARRDLLALSRQR